MAYANPGAWYVNYGNGSSTGYYGVTAWASGTPVAGQLCRQATTPAVGSERVFVCIIAGVDAVEPVWTVTKGAKNVGGSATWQECTGEPGVNGDISANCPIWTVSSTPPLGRIIYDSTSASLQICSTSGAGGTGAKPTFSATAGVTTSDASATWTSLGLASNFAAWAAPHARYANAIAANWGAAGNAFFIGDNHAETQSTNNQFSPLGSYSNPSFSYSVDHTAAVPPTGVKAGASISTTGNTEVLILGGATSFYFYGVTFNSGSGANNVTAQIGQSGQQWGNVEFDSCTIAIVATGSTASLLLFTGSDGGRITLNNTVLSFGAAGQTVKSSGGSIVWRNTASAIGGTAPTTLFTGAGVAPSILNVRGVDLSAITGTLVGAGGTLRGQFVNCATHSGAVLAATPTQPGSFVDFLFTDSAGTNYQQARFWYEGTLIPSTSIVRTGGAVQGTTPLSWNIATTANSKWWGPFECPATWLENGTTGSNVNVIIYGIWSGTAVPNNDQIWHDVEYYGSSSSPLASTGVGTKANNLATGSAWTADTSAWDSQATARLNSTVYAVGNIFSVSSNPGRLFIVTAIGSSPHQSAGSLPGAYATATDGQAGISDGNLTVQAMTRFSMTVGVTPQLAGYLRTYIKAATPSTTFYVDPQIVL